ncbi:MAG: fibronectin type III domain-containing protein, partial [bacterium]
YNIYSSDTNLLFSTTTATSTVFYGLTNGNTYNFYLTALNNVGESASSTIFSATPYTFPDAPTPATATAGDNTQANLTWTTPTFDGGSVLTSYYITNDKGIATTTIATTSLSAAITGLANNTTYTFSVYAINAAGTSTSAITNTILTVPVAPNLTLISGDSCSDGIAKLSWNSVAGASGYIIYRDGTEVIKTWNTYYDDRALTLNREYAYTVRAYNATGNSLSSNSQSITASFSCGSIPLVNYPENTNPYPSTPTPSATVATTTPTTTVSTTTVPGNATSTTNIIPGVTGNNTNNTGNGSTGNTTTTKPVVLPVTPDNINYTPTTCDPYLNSYIQLGKKNNPEEVKKLQIFLNDYENANLIVDGIYKAQDVKAVNAFQLKYKQDVLSFWGLHTPTGWVYISTQKAINRVYCEQTKQLSCPYFKATTNLKTIPTPDEILKIKVFLNNTQNENLNTSDNTFNTDLTNAVKRFQAKYATNILKPWRLTKPTGTWYQSTRKYADELLGCFYPVRLDNGVVLK